MLMPRYRTLLFLLLLAVLPLPFVACSLLQRKGPRVPCVPRAKISLIGLQGEQQTHESIDACPGITVQVFGAGKPMEVERITSMAVGVTTTSSYQIVRAPSALFTQEQRDLIKDADSFSVTDIRVVFAQSVALDSTCIEGDPGREHRVSGTIRILFPVVPQVWPDPNEDEYLPNGGFPRDYIPSPDGKHVRDYEPPMDEEEEDG
ncbi:MAG: hypothetical protein CSA07_03640 [Bacteroidia bacterium]|nr:MAG: hypothetical protein CSA07_03640 [Bacteroidia bacterium]